MIKKIDQIRAIHDAYVKDFELFARNELFIKTKKNTVIRFELNSAQKKVLNIMVRQLRETGKIRLVILKARQMGITTLIAAFQYYTTINKYAYKTFIVSHLASATKNVFDMVKYFHNGVHEFFKPQISTENASELCFRMMGENDGVTVDLGGKYAVGTAKSKNIGRSGTYNALHWSEVAFSDNQSEIIAGLVNTIPDEENTSITLESTGNGVNDYFHEMYWDAVAGNSKYEAVFLPWYMMDEYETDDKDLEMDDEDLKYMEVNGFVEKFGEKAARRKMAWRQDKIRASKGTLKEKRLLFSQEFPATPNEAFITNAESFIDPMLPMEARKNWREGKFEVGGATVVGVDPSGGKKDSTAIVVRQGRHVIAFTKYKEEDSLANASRIAGVIEKYKPDLVNVDAADFGVIDRLKDLGYGRIVKKVIGAAKADDFNGYANKRAECYGRMRDWFLDGAAIPDSDKHGNQAGANLFVQHLLTLGYSMDINKKIKLQSKSEITKSPDLADALAYTFAYPVISKQESSEIIRRSKPPREIKYGSI